MAKSKSKHIDLEIKDASLIFDRVWSDLEQEFGRAKLCFPGEIIWLGGAPGAGKGTNTPFILEARGITAAAIVISDLLDSPRAQQIKDAGGLVGDEEVTYLLLHKLLDPIYQRGVIVDGFPRTQVQVECLKLFYDKMTELREEFRNHDFPRPLFRTVLLFVDEEVSVERQLHRGREAQERNRKATESGVGQLAEIRATDLDPAAAQASATKYSRRRPLRRCARCAPFSTFASSTPASRSPKCNRRLRRSFPTRVRWSFRTRPSTASAPSRRPAASCSTPAKSWSSG